MIMGTKLLHDRAWFLAIYFYVSSGLIFFTYTVSKKTAGKYLLPGVLLLGLFQIYPAFYSGLVAFTNDSNGHQLSKSQAIDAIIQDSKIPIDSLSAVEYQAAIKDKTGELSIVFQYPISKFWIGNTTTSLQVARSKILIGDDGRLTKLNGYKLLTAAETEARSSELQNLNINLKSGISFQPQDLETLQASKPIFVFDRSADVLLNVETGEKYSPNADGQMVNRAGEILYPGWKTNIGWRNFSSIVSDKEIRRPLIAVLTWTFVNAFLVVTLSFLLGLILALIFNFPQLRSKRIYRTIFIIPMAIPSVLSVLVWSGLFTTKTGVIDRLFHISTPWLTDSFSARVAVLIVELWLTFPYMFLITTGAIQAIPNEILEAAEIDGASTLKSFNLIKLPLVIRTLGPLLVAGLAMALNNFGAIYLLTGGGPTFSNSNGNAGATDILISYTYKLAFNSQEGNNYGLASALSILNFILVGAISVYGLRRMKTMEGVN
jgi:arabinogalactan oligomer/maltooligosaccharide transport system permease protein